MYRIKKYLIAIALMFGILTVDNQASLYVVPEIKQFAIYLPDYKFKPIIHSISLNQKKVRVRLTCYWAKGSDTDSWSEHKESTTGTRLKSGVSAAVDPRIIPYYSKIIIPNGPTLIAHDTGTDVINRKASHGRLPIVDVFFNTEREAMIFASATPLIVTVTILN